MARLKREPVSEQQLGEIVVAYLEALGADVYQEVECAGGVADIVAKVQAELWIVEVKTALSLALLCQAMRRREDAHRVFIAAPCMRTRSPIGEICEELGIGLLDVSPPAEGVSVAGFPFGQAAVRVVVDARRCNRRPLALAARLTPEHKTHAKAGAVGAGGRWTPFRATCEELERIARAKPGVTLKDAIAEIRHHYRTAASARSSLVHWIQRGKVPGVRLDVELGAPRLFPVELRKDTNT